MSESTITVATHFGDTQINREDFISQWTSHVRQLKMLSWKDSWLERVEKMISATEAEASLEFDRLLEVQNKINQNNA